MLAVSIEYADDSYRRAQALGNQGIQNLFKLPVFEYGVLETVFR